MHQNKGVIGNLKPKTAFKAGLLSGLGIIFIIGFFILLGIMLNDKYGNDNGSNTNTNTNTNNPGDTTATTMEVKPIDDNDSIRGNKNAKVSVITFTDINCPFCLRLHTTMNQILDTYSDDIKWTYRHFPIPSLSGHAESPKQAEAAECVAELGGNDKFWSFMERMFTEKTPVANLANMVSGMGINSVAFQECLDSGKYTAKIQSDTQQAQIAGRVGCPQGLGTPFSIILAGDQQIPICGALPYESLSSAIDSFLK